MTDARRAIHIALTVILAGIAVVLALPGSTFSTNHVYDPMAPP